MAGVTPFDTEFLISLVETKPVLWDKTFNKYKDKALTKNAWREIYEELHSGFAELEDTKKNEFGKNVTKKWWNIRDGFHKSRKKQREALKTGQDPSKIKKYIYEDQLHFLVKMTGERQNEVEDSLDEEKYQHNKNLIMPQKRKLDQALLTSPIITSEDRHMSFFKGIMPSLSYFDDEETVQFQLGVLQLIWNIKQQKIVKQETASVPSASSPLPSPTQSSTYIYTDKNHTFFNDSPSEPTKKKRKKVDEHTEKQLPSSAVSTNSALETSFVKNINPLFKETLSGPSKKIREVDESVEKELPSFLSTNSVLEKHSVKKTHPFFKNSSSEPTKKTRKVDEPIEKQLPSRVSNNSVLETSLKPSNKIRNVDEIVEKEIPSPLSTDYVLDEDCSSSSSTVDSCND